MNRYTMKMLLAALVAVFAVSSMAEAAPKKQVVRHRTKHSSRVSAGASASNSKSAVAKKKPAPAARKKPAPNASATTAHKPAAKKPAVTRRTPTTKPR